jgi:hypothetical protein
MEIRVVADRHAGGLDEDKPKQWIALLRDLAEMVLIRGSVEGGRQANVAGDLLSSWKPADRPEDNHGGEGRHTTHARMGEQKPGGRIDRRRLGDLVIELPYALVEPFQQFEALVATAGGVWPEREVLELGEAGLGQALRAVYQAVAERDRVEGISSWSSENGPAACDARGGRADREWLGQGPR